MMQNEEKEVGGHQSSFQQPPSQSQDTEGEFSAVHLSTSRERHTSRQLNALFWKNKVCPHKLALLQ